MNDISLYEKIPLQQYPIRIHVRKEYKVDFPPHWHEHTEIHYIFRGSCNIKCGEEEINLSADDCAIINTNELHEGAGGLCDSICIILPPNFVEQNHIIFKRIVKDEYVSEMVHNIYERYCTGSPIDLLEIKGYSYLLISHLIKKYAVRSLNDTVYSKYFNKLNKVNDAIRFISENYDKPLTTKALAEKVHLSEGYFCQVFKEVTGKTAVEYINNLRIDKAEKMLVTTDVSISEVAFCCGFDDANYFSRTYKKIKGETPHSTRSAGGQTKNEIS
ncbi:MAG: AraC family transcriptional regulator [Ruminococcaceae bacterium]|nr:AraC family transcriptional regulator [Oscillospiraceae bacterium]